MEISLTFLHEAYQQESWFFELLDIAHKLLLSSLLVFLPKDYQIPCGLAAAGAYGITILVQKPYVRAIDDRLHLLAQIELIVIFMSGWVLFHDTDAKMDDFTDFALSVLLIAVILGLIGLFLYHVFLNVRNRYYSLKRKLAKEHTKGSLFESSPRFSILTTGSPRPSVESIGLAPPALPDEEMMEFNTGREGMRDHSPVSPVSPGGLRDSVCVENSYE
jgi:hypothetical protein